MLLNLRLYRAVSLCARAGSLNTHWFHVSRIALAFSMAAIVAFWSLTRLGLPAGVVSVGESLVTVICALFRHASSSWNGLRSLVPYVLAAL